MQRFILANDAVLHQVVTRKIMVAVEQDWAAGQLHRPPRLHWASFRSTWSTTASGRFASPGQGVHGLPGHGAPGLQHIAKGTDYLLFLLALLLVA